MLTIFTILGAVVALAVVIFLAFWLIKIIVWVVTFVLIGGAVIGIGLGVFMIIKKLYFSKPEKTYDPSKTTGA